MSALAYVEVPDGFGGTRHELRAVNDTGPAKGKKKARKAPDPIVASAESSAQMLRQFIERAERMMEEIVGLQDDLRDIFAEARSQGYDNKAMKKIIARRKIEKHVLDEDDAIFETYKAALGLD